MNDPDKKTEDEMIEDKLTASQRIRLEALALATAQSYVSDQAVKNATVYEDFIVNGRKKETLDDAR